MANRLTWSFFNYVYRIGTPKPLDETSGTDTIISLLNSDKPCMISRIGSGELQALSYVKFWPFLLPLKSRTYKLISNNAGFFPVTLDNLKTFFEIHIDAISNLDILITWRFEEIFFRKNFKKTKRVSKDTLDDFFKQQNPWTQALEDKRVLVIHPFAKTIEKQYFQHREQLFANPLVLPKFKSLVTIKAVQSIAGNNVEYETWFDALDYMKREIDKHDFDIAILGCGAYGMPLAAYIKRSGKKAIHMGGITQFLFGIKGKRYIDYEKTNNYINEYFVFPPESDRPQKAEIVEGGCYW